MSVNCFTKYFSHLCAYINNLSHLNPKRFPKQQEIRTSEIYAAQRRTKV